MSIADMPIDTPTLWDALAGVQAALPAVGKTRQADTGKYTYRYADLTDVHAALLPLLAQHGLVWTATGKSPSSDAGRPFGLSGTMTHVATGEVFESWWPMPDGTDPQRLGAAVTYARRYMLCAMVGLVPDDDDDAAAATTWAQDPPADITMKDLLDVIDKAQAAEVVGDFDATVEWAAQSPANCRAAYRKIAAALSAANPDDTPSPYGYG